MPESVFWWRIQRWQALLLAWIVIGLLSPVFMVALGVLHELVNVVSPSTSYTAYDVMSVFVAGLFVACLVGLAVVFRRRYTVAISHETITVGTLRGEVTIALDQVREVRTSASLLAHPVVEPVSGRSVTVRCLQQSMFPTQHHRAFIEALRDANVELVRMERMSRWRGRQLVAEATRQIVDDR